MAQLRRSVCRRLLGTGISLLLTSIISNELIHSAPASAIALSTHNGIDHPTSETQPCERLVVFIHDTAATSHRLQKLQRSITTGTAQIPRLCTRSFDYGKNNFSRQLAAQGGPLLSGLTSFESSAKEIKRSLTKLPAHKKLVIVAHGGGGLAIQYLLSRNLFTINNSHLPAINTLITIGPIWRGTNISALGDIENISRALGTYNAILQLERPIIDPICAGCRSLVRGSDFLKELFTHPIPTPGVNYYNIISMTDGLVSNPLTSLVAGMKSTVLQHKYPQEFPNHFQLPTNSAVQNLLNDYLTAMQ